MAKVKLQFENTLEKKFLVACDINDVKVINTMQAGEVTVCEVNYKHPGQLFSLGRMIDKVSDSYNNKPTLKIEPELKSSPLVNSGKAAKK
ncbi:MAG: hypothetical protein WC389_05455 [Lutibacter sp.]|jgi:hypothetical protein